MGFVLRLLVTVVVGAIGGVIASKLNIPAGYMVGSLIIVMAINLTAGHMYIPSNLRVFVQMLSGALIGSRVTRDEIRELRYIVTPVILLLVSFVLLMLAIGSLLWLVGGLDPVTALYASAPGGVSDMGLIAGEFGANTAMVTMLQMIHLVSVVVSYPLIFKWMEHKGILEGRSLQKMQGAAKAASPTRGELIRGTTLTFVCGIAGGFFLWTINFPAGAIVGGMLGAACLSIATPELHIEGRLRSGIQVFSGAYLGTQITRNDAILMASSGMSVLIVIVSVLTLPILFGYLVHKATGADLGTMLFSATPGGVQEMALLAEDMGLDAPKISIAHTARLVVVLAAFPTLIRFMLSFVV